MFDDDAVIPWCCFRERHCRDQVNVVRLRRAPAAAVVWNTQTHTGCPDKQLMRIASLHLMLLDSHILPPPPKRAPSRCTVGAGKKGVQWQEKQTAS